MDNILFDFYKGKRIFITGAAGTVGREIVKQLLPLEPAELRLMDNNETETFFLMDEYKDENVSCFIGDVRDREKLEKRANGVDVIIHSAALGRGEAVPREETGSDVRDLGITDRRITGGVKNTEV